MTYDLQRAKRYCVWLLSRRELSEHQLIQKLKGKGCEEETISGAVSWAKEMGFQSDERCAASKSRLEAKGRGNFLVKKRMEAIGLDGELVQSALESQPPESERLRELCVKFSGKLDDEKGYNKAIRYLVSRGFSYRESKKALDSLKTN